MDPTSATGTRWPARTCYSLALTNCTFCGGSGQVGLYKRLTARVCKCVYRAVFRECYERYELCRGSQAGGASCVSSDVRSVSFSRRLEEYIADFELTAQRVLKGRDLQIFQEFVISGLPAADCLVRFRLDRGTFYHAIYRIEEQAGRAFREQSCPLHPASRYLGSRNREYLRPRRQMPVEALDYLYEGTIQTWRESSHRFFTA